MNNAPQHGSISQITFERPVMKRGKYNKPKAEHPKRIHRTKKQIRKDSLIIRDMIAEGKTAKQIASEMGLTRGAIEHQIVRHKLRSKAKRKPRIVYAKPTFWQKCKRIISNLWG